MLPQKILKSRGSEMPFPAFWGKILQNSGGQRTSLGVSCTKANNATFVKLAEEL